MKKTKKEKGNPEPKPNKGEFIVSEAEQEAGEASYDITGPFGIGITKAK
jgi:hypothetical protein